MGTAHKEKFRNFGHDKTSTFVILSLLRVEFLCFPTACAHLGGLLPSGETPSLQ